MSDEMTSIFPLTGYGIELTEITEDKLEKIRAWRNHPEIVEFMIDKRHISAAQQQKWFQGLADKKHQLYLLISYKGEDIGVIYAVSDNDEQQALSLAQVIAPGLYISPECKYKNSVLAFSPSLVFIDYLFNQGSCKTLQAQVFAHNDSAIRYNEMLGYQQGITDGKGLVTMSLSQQEFQQAKKKLSTILRF